MIIINACPALRSHLQRVSIHVPDVRSSIGLRTTITSPTVYATIIPAKYNTLIPLISNTRTDFGQKKFTDKN